MERLKALLSQKLDAHTGKKWAANPGTLPAWALEIAGIKASALDRPWERA